MTLIFFSTLIISFMLLKIFILYSGKLGIVDIPNGRSSHVKSTPSGSGIAIFSAVILVLFFIDLKEYQNYSLSIIAVLFIFALGIYDDLKNSPALYKLAIITLGAIFICFDGLIIVNLGTYFGYPVILSSLWLSIPFTIITVVGFTNALNLIDGLDGLAGGISIIIFSSLWYVGSQHSIPLLLLASPIMIAALLGFLAFNWNPAKAFMGDSGSLTLGFIISILSISAISQEVNPIVILYLLALPIIDTLLVIVRRKRNNLPIFAPDRNHIHHILLDVFDGRVKRTVITILFIQVLYTSFGLIVVESIPQEIALLLFVISLISLYLLTKKTHKKIR
jgi:UDP-GlcNAc:undecaprenyl-phosphate GlcNAc-1-phosphate transferase